MNTHPLLELELHLVNGNTHRFVQNDPDLARELLKQINRKIFGQTSLIVHGEKQVCVYHGPMLAGISVIMEPLPGELLMLDPASPAAWEITEEEFREKQKSLPPVVADEPFLMLTEIELTTGRRIWLERQIPCAMGGLDERKILHHSFILPNLVCRRAGGISIWNRAQMISLTFSPKPEVPAVAWPAEPVGRPLALPEPPEFFELCGIAPVRERTLGYGESYANVRR
jgi:hypothetical protein